MGETHDLANTLASSAVVNLQNTNEPLSWHQFIDLAPYAVCIIRIKDGGILFSNKAVSRIFGYEIDQFTGQNIFDIGIFTDPDIRQKIFIEMEGRITKSDWVIPYSWQAQQPRTGSFSFQKIIYQDHRCYLLFCNDITKAKQKEQYLEQQLEFYKSLVEHAKDIPWQLNAHGQIMYIGPGVQQWGYVASELAGKSLYRIVHSSDKDKIANNIKSIISGNTPSDLIRTRIKNANGSYSQMEISSVPLFDSNKNIIGVYGIVRDISHRLKIEEKLRKRASTDSLTGLLDRSNFYRRLGSTLKNDTLFKQGIALFFVDVDDFKLINDDLGHGVGDQCLKKIAKVIKSVIRDTDSASRVGGDEFAILINPANLDIIDNICKRIQHQVEAKCPANQLPGHELTLSIGICFAKEKIRLSSLVQSADRAMYIAKHQGKNRFHIMEN